MVVYFVFEEMHYYPSVVRALQRRHSCYLQYQAPGGQNGPLCGMKAENANFGLNAVWADS